MIYLRLSHAYLTPTFFDSAIDKYKGYDYANTSATLLYLVMKLLFVLANCLSKISDFTTLLPLFVKVKVFLPCLVIYYSWQSLIRYIDLARYLQDLVRCKKTIHKFCAFTEHESFWKSLVLLRRNNLPQIFLNWNENRNILTYLNRRS